MSNKFTQRSNKDIALLTVDKDSSVVCHEQS